jgi:hypothetical protein
MNPIRIVTECDPPWIMHAIVFPGRLVHGFVTHEGIDLDADLAREYIRTYFPDYTICIATKMEAI